MRKFKNILVGAWLSVGCLPMWAMDQLPLTPQVAEKREGPVRVAFLNDSEQCKICLFFRGQDNFQSFFRVPFHLNIETDKPFLENNLQSIVDILQEDGEPMTEDRWNRTVHVIKHGIDEGPVQQDRVAGAVGALPDDKINTITGLYNDMLDQIRTFIVEGIEGINVFSNRIYVTVECFFRWFCYGFSLPFKVEEEDAGRVAMAMSRFIAGLVRLWGAIPSTIDPITQKICNKMARPRFVAKSPEQQARILCRAIRMILIGQGHSLEESSVLSSGIVDQWSQLKEQLDNDVTWTQDSDYHVKNVWIGRKLVKQEGEGRRTPVQTQRRGHRGGVSTDAYLRSIPAEQQFPPLLRIPTWENLVAELEELEILSAEAKKKGDDYSVGVLTKRRQVVQKQLDAFYSFHVQLHTSSCTKIDETYGLMTGVTKTGSSATAEVPGTNPDTRTTPVPKSPSSLPLTVRFGLPMGFKF